MSPNNSLCNFILNTVPRKRAPIHVLAETGEAQIYRTISLKGEEIEVFCHKEMDSLLREESDLLLLDCGFEQEKGLRVLREFKESRPDVPVLFITEAGSKETALAAFRAGARDYIEKPFDLMELKKKVQDFLSIKRGSRERRFRFRADDPLIPAPRPVFMNKPASILKAVQYIEENFSEKIRLETLAQQAGMSKFHFSRLFFRYTGMSPIRYVTFLRIEQAKKYLARGGATVSFLAQEIGFNDLGTFIRQFKRQTGCTPTAFQESYFKGKISGNNGAVTSADRGENRTRASYPEA
jgi:AraC-like DNA-binding protein